MDQPDLAPELHRRALDGLRRINVISRTPAVLWRKLRTIAGDQPLKVLDLACGGGDVVVELAKRAAEQKLAWQIAGCDRSAVAVAHSRARAERASITVEFFTLDVLNDPLPTDYDVVMCSLFLHHLAEDDVARLLGRAAAAARRCVLADDLIRSRAGYALAWLGCRLLSRSPVVHVDGPRSVEGALTIQEIGALAARAGLADVRITRHWPRRFLLEWHKS